MNNDFQKNYAAFIFDWTGFSEKNLIEMNQEHEPDIYGFILLKYDGQLYVADIQWETIAAYDRRGISINLYHSNESWNHCGWICDIKEIVTATNYKRFQHRAEKEIIKIFCS